MTDDRGTDGRDATGRSPLAPHDSDLPDPLLPDQPEDAERPVPLRAAPERTHDPSDWDDGDDEDQTPQRLSPREPLGAEAGRDLREEVPESVEREGSYSTELQQGAVHPIDTGREGDDGG